MVNSYLENESDLNIMVKALRLVLRIARTEPLASKLHLQPRGEKTQENIFWPGDADPDEGEHSLIGPKAGINDY